MHLHLTIIFYFPFFFRAFVFGFCFGFSCGMAHLHMAYGAWCSV